MPDLNVRNRLLRPGKNISSPESSSWYVRLAIVSTCSSTALGHQPLGNLPWQILMQSMTEQYVMQCW